jgi:hypothetical protein
MACIKPLDEQEWFPGTIRMNVKLLDSGVWEQFGPERPRVIAGSVNPRVLVTRAAESTQG